MDHQLCVNLCRLIQSEKNQRWLDSRSDASWITYEMEAVAELREAIGAIQGMIGLQEEVVRAQLELGELLLTAAQDKILQSASAIWHRHNALCNNSPTQDRWCNRR
jgi:hypothetical protein